MFSMMREALAAMPWLILAMSPLANAACECGYSVNASTSDQFTSYTDLMENDFLHTVVDNITEAGWRVQVYNVSSTVLPPQPYGKNFTLENVESNPLKDKYSWTGDSENGGDAGLRLWVRGDTSNGYVQSAEVASVREDILHGSFRIGMKLSGAGATCGAFFWFHSDAQEIDMEFLSKDFTDTQSLVNLVLQTPESVAAGYDASNTSEYKKQPLYFRPDEKVHEYRYDWAPGSVKFYVDGTFVYEMTENIPVDAGHMLMNHWSNGNALWSGGPPKQDTYLTVTYVKSYFNTTNTAKNNAYKSRCANWNATQVCEIPTQTVAPDPSGADGNTTANTYFFSLDGTDKVPGQDVYPSTNGGSSLFGSTSISIYVPVMVALFSWAFAI
ncbi:glycoside hydrolase family 16 protein [Pleomassaria siparia CBS 279.74]|uniref:Glycoside hydrolase family 16 protein n=1 Tax=Pleomassaria siparia CBS 279.74 TaxID=1314801 RepID=A0A6G1K035_9PLEO|nr:glycoside hydrolase family 16 protein [Pleomassaria siparia CBS 279.74]